MNWKPVISAVHGYVLGVGFGLAMATDLIVAAAGTQFQIREIQRGIAGAQHWATTWFWGGQRRLSVALHGPGRRRAQHQPEGQGDAQP